MKKYDKEFIPYQEALELKQLGFDEPCFGKWLSSAQSNWKEYELILEMGMNEEFEDNRNSYLLEEACSSLTYSQCFRWFREKYDLVHRIDRNGGWWICTILNLYDEKEQGAIEIHIEHCYPDTYEEAELACLRKLIEIVKSE